MGSVFGDDGEKLYVFNSVVLVIKAYSIYLQYNIKQGDVWIKLSIKQIAIYFGTLF